MKKDRLLELLLRETDNDLSDAERSELDLWLQQSSANQQKANQIREYWKLSGQLDSDISIDIEKDFAIVRNKINREKGRTLGRIWMVAATILLLTGIWFIYPYFSSGARVQYSGPVKGITLRDGTSIDLEDHSLFDFKLTKETREGHLTGRGYFAVASDVQRPFTISSHIGQITVVGTSFAVDASSKDQLVVAVDQGNVMLKNSASHELKITAGEEARMTNQVIQKSFLQQPAGYWRLEAQAFEQTPLAMVITQIEQYYHIKIAVDQAAVADCKVNFTLSYPPLDQLISILETLLEIKVEKTGDKDYIIKGSGCS